MNHDCLVSDHLVELRRFVGATLRRSSLSGRAVRLGEIHLITEKLNTAVALAKELEEENRILDQRLKANLDAPRNRKAAADITDVASSETVTAFRLPLSSKI